ncbi:hypothetical protein C8R47DRAFT_1189928 [Mycena vitilis]|nr:hypothetical protein C8R47DRAFT_1189928 [Mycena vitilis]
MKHPILSRNCVVRVALAGPGSCYSTSQLIAEVKRLIRGPATWTAQSSRPPTLASTKTFVGGNCVQFLPGERFFGEFRGPSFCCYDVTSGTCVWTCPVPSTRIKVWTAEIGDDGESAIFFLIQIAGGTNRDELSIVHVDFRTGESEILFAVVLHSRVGVCCHPALFGDFLGMELVYTPWGRSERAVIVLDWRNRVFVTFACSPASEETRVAFIPGHILLYNTTAGPHADLCAVYTMASIASRWQPVNDIQSTTQLAVRAFDGLRISSADIPPAIVERLEPNDRVFRDDLRVQMTVHPNPIRSNTYQLTLYVSNPMWVTNTSLKDTLRRTVGQPSRRVDGAMLYTQRLTVGAPPDYRLTWVRISAVPAVPNIASPISYAGYGVSYSDRAPRAATCEAGIVDARLPPRRFLLGQTVREVVALPDASNYSIVSSAGVTIIRRQEVEMLHYA